MGAEILGLGEVVVDWVSVVDHFPEPDEKIDAKSQTLFSGGVTANYAVATARLGANTAFFGAIGDDNFGSFLQNDFEREQVNTTFLLKKPNQQTPVNFIVVNEKSGEKFIVQSPFMHTTVPTLSDYTPQAMEEVKLIHSTAIYPELTLKMFRYAQDHGILTSLDLEKQIAIWGLDQLRPILEHTDILLPNKAGAMQLTGTSSPEAAAKQFLEWGIDLVVITLGAEGAAAFSRTETIHVPAFKVPVKDTTGAGDTFCAAFTYTFGIKEWDIRSALEFAVGAASMKIQHLGARTGMPTFKGVQTFLDEQK